MSYAAQTPQFGKKSRHSVVISSNGKVREYRIHAGLLLAVGSIFTMFMVGYVAATAYIAFRDDLVAAAYKNQTRMKQEYEDRIAALRSRVDRITSRQLLDQQAVEAKVAALMRQQEMLSGRSGALQGLLDRAKASGLEEAAVPIPERNPQKAEIVPTDNVITGSIHGAGDVFADAASFLRGSASGIGANAEANGLITSIPTEGFETAQVFDSVLDQINAVEKAQRSQVLALHSAAHSRTSHLANVFEKLNVPLPGVIAQDIGGPYVPAGDMAFEDLTDDLESALDRLDLLKKKARRLPVSNPVPGAKVSSSFGRRVDPFHRKSAFHAGIDFRARTGTPVLATGSGKVVKAGRNGGYGLMVEIEHGYGITTRYAHLSKILVKAGDRVSNNQRIGRVGSTGRSTGPHLHYEIRRSEKASNPARYLKVGRELSKMLKS